MKSLVITAAATAFLLATAAPALAEDYPPCTSPGQDHCRVVPKAHKSHHHHGSHKKGKDMPGMKTDDKAKSQ
jgi:hypothetical protein